MVDLFHRESFFVRITTSLFVTLSLLILISHLVYCLLYHDESQFILCQWRLSHSLLRTYALHKAAKPNHRLHTLVLYLCSLNHVLQIYNSIAGITLLYFKIAVGNNLISLILPQDEVHHEGARETNEH